LHPFAPNTDLFRIIYYVKLFDAVLMVTIYSKTELVDVTPEEIRTIIDDVFEDPDSDNMP